MIGERPKKNEVNPQAQSSGYGSSYELRRMVALLAAWLSAAASVLILVGALLTDDPKAAQRVVSPLIVCAIGFYQLHTRRYRTELLLLLAAALTVGQVAILGSGTYSQAAAVALVGIGVVWTMFLPEVRWWHMASYSLSIVFAQLLWDWGAAVSDILGSAAGGVAAFLGLAIITNWLQRAVRSSEERYRDLFEDSPVALWEEDFSQVRARLDELSIGGVSDLPTYLAEHPSELDRLIGLVEVIDVSDEAVRLLGAKSRDELLGKLPPMHTPSSRRSFTAQVLALWEGREVLEYEFRGELRTGEHRDLNIRWSVMSRNDTGSRLVVVAMSDITERKAAERALQESRDQFARLAANAADAITRLRLAPEPTWEYVSPAVERICGYSPEDFYADGYIMRKITHPDDRERLATFMQHPERWDEALTIRLLSRSGKEVWAEMRLTPIYDEEGRLSYIETITRDVTERKEHQTRLEELIRSKDDFVASVSHELRTPLTAVVGLAQELRDHRDAFRPEEASELIEMIASQSTEVADIVNDLLVAARADTGTVSIHREAVDLSVEVKTVVAALAEEDRAKVQVLGSPSVCTADPTRIRQIVRNLLTNASRYGGSHIEIETAIRDGRATLAVRDDGEGIEPEDVERIFDPYHRAHANRTQPASVGLGLTVSRQLARLMDGDVTYRQQDGYSVFELTLPVADPQKIPAGTGAGGWQPSSPDVAAVRLKSDR